MQLPTLGKLSPLWIVSIFVTFTEAVLGYAVTQTTGGVQIALTVFVICFAFLVAAAFFSVLWFKPHHFYAPTDFGDMDPKAFVDALGSVPQVVLQAAQEASDPTLLYKLLARILDASHQQHLILMAERSVEIPWSATTGGDPFEGAHRYRHGTQHSRLASGWFAAPDLVRKLDGTDFIRVLGEGGTRRLQIAPAGIDFARWLVKNGKKDEFLETPLGGWGTPFQQLN